MNNVSHANLRNRCVLVARCGAGPACELATQAARKRARALGTTKPSARDAPWPIMLLTGLAVLISGMIALGLFTGEKPGGVYVPPHMETGEIIRGHIDR